MQWQQNNGPRFTNLSCSKLLIGITFPNKMGEHILRQSNFSWRKEQHNVLQTESFIRCFLMSFVIGTISQWYIQTMNGIKTKCKAWTFFQCGIWVTTQTRIAPFFLQPCSCSWNVFLCQVLIFRSSRSLLISFFNTGKAEGEPWRDPLIVSQTDPHPAPRNTRRAGNGAK